MLFGIFHYAHLRMYSKLYPIFLIFNVFIIGIVFKILCSKNAVFSHI